MKKIKPVIKIFIGVAVLVFVITVFFLTQQNGSLESGTLQNWKTASNERRVAAAQILIGEDANTELLVACVDKMSELPDSGEMMVRDAVSLCHTGIKLKENL